MDFRTLRRSEREALLELLDGFEVGDGWRGRDFFRRSLEQDPSYADENVWVAVDGARLVGCVQLFPRRLRLQSGDVASGGLGSVFTAPDARCRGIGAVLVGHAAEQMRARGLALSLLFAARVPWYEKLGWRPLGAARSVVERASAPPPPGAPRIDARCFEASRDLDAVKRMYAIFSGARPGSVARDDALWEASLHLAGHPDEDFLVAPEVGEPRAYARAIVLAGLLTLAELGCDPGAEDALAALVERLLAPREPDALAARAGAAGDVRRRALGPGLSGDPALAAALARRGLAIHAFVDRSAMLRCLDARALAAAAGVEPIAGELPEALVARVLPPERFVFWPADRF